MTPDQEQQMAAARDKWWRELTAKSDPSQVPNLAHVAFDAGYRAAAQAYAVAMRVDPAGTRLVPAVPTGQNPEPPPDHGAYPRKNL